MAGVVRAMDAAMKGMNLEKISSLMDKFEQQFEDLDVQSSYMENTMSQTTTTAVPQGDVDSLLSQVADEAGYAQNNDSPTAIFFSNDNFFFFVQAGTQFGATKRTAKLDCRRFHSGVTRTRRIEPTFGQTPSIRIRTNTNY